jgi:Putative DNA-binding domain
MAALNIISTRQRLQNFEFHDLFIEELGWSQPAGNKPASYTIEDSPLTCTQIAQLGGVAVIEVSNPQGTIPSADIRRSLQKEISKSTHENLLVFVDDKRTQSLWYWIKRESGKQFVREHYYFKGQPGDLFLTKLSSMVIDISDLDENGDILVTEVVNRLKNALDIERVIKRFYREYTEQRLSFTDLITGIKDERDKRWYASIILNRLMFVYFLQGKGFLNKCDFRYLQGKLLECRDKYGKDKFFSVFLNPLFFEGFAKPEKDRSASAIALLGEIKYLNGGLFLPHRIEIENKNIKIPDKAFENLFQLFQAYSWNLDDTPGGDDNDMNPDVLGYIFEKYINQKAFGAYYTRTEMTEYLCERTIYKLVLDRIKTDGVPGVIAPVKFNTISDLLFNLNADLCRALLFDILPKLSILDPACGSGAFLVAAMKTLINLYSAIIGRIEFLNDRSLKNWLKDIHTKHPSTNYYIKKTIITDNLFGVDIMEEATEIAKLRLFLALVASATSVDDLEPLPNIDFNIMAGNSLVGLLKVDKKAFEESDDIITQSYYHTYTERLAERNRLLDTYRHASTYAEDLRSLRDDIEKKSKEVRVTLDHLLLDQFGRLGIQYQEATWDDKKKKEGKPKKRSLKISDIEKLKPFHWGFEFSEIMEKRGGFDAIVTNPPWEVFQTDEKEFFQRYDDTIQKKKIRIEDWKKQFSKLMKDEDVREAWLAYSSEYPHLSDYFKLNPHYKNQVSIVNGRSFGGKLNLYALFLEQSYHLIREGGECGIVIPSGIYTDLGTKRLREMLFEETLVTGLFCFENRKEIFENVDSRFKFVVLTYKKGDVTKSFPVRFMRHDVAELEHFPNEGDLRISVDLIRKLSPDSMALLEFSSSLDIRIANKLSKWPMLGNQIEGAWNISLMQEMNMTSDSKIFRTEPGQKRVPLVQGNMFHQFNAQYAEPKYWIDHKEGRENILGRTEDNGQIISYEAYRFVHRRIARNTDERTAISTVLAPRRFCADTAQTTRNILRESDLVFLVAVFNAFVADWEIRLRVTTHMDMHFVHTMHIPRLTKSDKWYSKIVSRAARLICTTPDFDDLANEVGLKSHKNGVTDPIERAKLRAELDGIIAHLYELTEEEFAYILTTFPLVAQPVKDAALEQYRAFAPKSSDEEVLSLIKSGEGHSLEFKETARWDVRQNQPSKVMEKVVLDTVAAFLNSEGGTLLIGVKDDKTVAGLEPDYHVFGKKENMRDIYENWLVQYLLSQYQKDIAPCLKVTFHQINGKDVCRLTISPSPRAVYVRDGNNEQFFIRTGNSKKQLSTSETVQYCKQKWPV